MNYVKVKSPLGDAVDVLVDERWVPGVLYSWRRGDDGRWQGYVHYTPTPGSTYVASIDQDRLREADRDRENY